jgi:putative sigma-54 modulation protein
MEIVIQSIHFDADIKLLEFIQKKLSKLENLNDRIINADVYLKLDKADDKENKIVEVKLHLPGLDLFTKEQSRTFEESTDMCVESLKKQITKAKEKARA